MNKKERRIRKDTIVTLADFISPDLALISMIIGIDPGISIIAKRTINAARISIRLKCIFQKFCAKIYKFHVFWPPCPP
jgi:uncharacterized membrane protein